MRKEQITSGGNPKIKTLLALQEKSGFRREKGLFVVEGRREIEHCIEAGFTIDTLFICPEICPSAPDCQCSTFIEVPAELYSKIACRKSTEGILAEVRTKDVRLEDLKLSDKALVVVLESVEKPGNIGAVLRSADAAGADAVIICDPLTDLFNPNLIRASLGGIFTVQCAAASSEEAIRFLKDKKINILTAQLQDSRWYYDTDMRESTAIVIGTESTGLSDIWRRAADARIKIPMLGKLDSLNASVSAAVLLYEAVRQRNLVIPEK